MQATIKIDRETIKPNPNAGRTAIRVETSRSATPHTDRPVEDPRYEKWLKSASTSTSGVSAFEYEIPSELLEDARWRGSVTVQRNWETSNTFAPDPDYLYSYCRSLTCPSCGAEHDEFDFRLADEDDTLEYKPVAHMCPDCSARLEVSWEPIAAALSDPAVIDRLATQREKLAQ
jgi:hypothetical protein